MKNPMPFYVRMFVAMAYIIFGIVCLTTRFAEVKLESKFYGMMLGVVLLGYGIFRAYRAVKQWDTPNHER